MLENRKQFIFPLLAFGLLVVLYASTFHLGSYIDDNFLIFTNPFIKSAQNPLQYWYRGQFNTKSWPLTHSVYWLLYQMFHLHFAYYRILLLLLHWVNGTLLFCFLRKKNFSAALFSACLFWFHPITVEIVTWISQLGSVMCTIFFAWWLKNFLEPKVMASRRSFFLLLGIVSTKAYGFFLAPLEIVKNRSQMSWLRSIWIEIPALLLSAYSLFLVSVGVYSYKNESLHAPKYFSIPATKAPPPVAVAPPAITPPIAAEPTFMPPKYSQDQIPKNAPEVFAKFSALGRTSCFYFVRFFTTLELPISKPAAFQEWNGFFFFIACALIALFIYSLWKGIWLFAALFCVYLPVSGLFYVPFMKDGLIADRVFYLPLFAVAWFMGDAYSAIKNPWLRKMLWLMPLLFFVFTIFAIQKPRAEFPL